MVVMGHMIILTTIEIKGESFIQIEKIVIRKLVG